MIYLFNNDDQIKFKIIKYLNTPSLPICTITSLAEKTSVSAKTVIKYIVEMKTDFPEIIVYDLSIKAVRLNLYSKKIEQKIVRKMIINSICIKVLLDYLFFPLKPTHQRVNDLNISDSTLYRLHNKINQHLAQFDIELVSHHNHFIFKSKSETAIRKYFTCLFMEINEISTYPKSPIDLSLLLEYIKKIYEYKQCFYDDIILNFATFYYMISLYREEWINEDLMNLLSESDIRLGMELSESLVSEIPSLSSFEDSVNKSFIELLYYIQSSSNAENYSVDPALSTHLNKEFSGKLDNDINSFVDYMGKQLLQTYLIHPYKTSVFIDRVEDFVINLNNDFPSIVEKFSSALKASNISDKMAELIRNDLIYWTLTHHPHILTLNSKKIEIYIYYDMSQASTNFIVSILKSKLIYTDYIDFITLPRSDKEDITHNNNSIVLSTFEPQNFKPLLVIDDYPNSSQINLINNILCKMFSNDF